MRLSRLALFAAVTTAATACSFLLDFDELQTETGDASIGGSAGTAGSGGTAGSAGAAGGGGVAGLGGSGGAAGASGAAGGDGGPPGVALDDIPKVLGQAVCANIDVCLGPGKEFLIGQEDCQDLFENSLRDGVVAALKTSIAAGASYDPIAGAACVAKMEALTASGVCAELDKFFEDCKSAFTGLGKQGDPCKHPYACGKGLYCPLTTCTNETCIPYKTQGMTCASTDECALGLTCFIKKADDGGVANSGTCEPYTPIDAACDEIGANQTPDCKIGGYCIGSGSAKKCHKIPTLFASPSNCYSNSLFCAPGKSCQLSGAIPFLWSGNCVNEVVGGGACTLSFPDMCAKGSFCPAGFFNAQTNCLILPAVGQPCAKTFQQTLGFAPPCAQSLVCVSDVCKPRKKLTEACDADEQCYSGNCVGGADGGAKSCVPAVCP